MSGSILGPLVFGSPHMGFALTCFSYGSLYYGRKVDDKNLGPGPYYDRWQRPLGAESTQIPAESEL